MGSGDWLKNIISPKKDKENKHLKSNGVKQKNESQKESTKLSNGASNKKKRFVNLPSEDVAATRIQNAFRSYKARKSLRRLKGIAKLHSLIQNNTVSKQASTTLNHLHSWSRIQAQITARRLSMVSEGRLRQKKLENQLKLEAKLHDLEVEWCGGSETMEETLSRIHHREEAAVKRERALAYAFSHQWRANPSLFPGPPELAKANWGWSWTERWIAARPWENRVPLHSSPKKTQSRATVKTAKTTPLKMPVSLKVVSPNGKGPKGARKLTYPGNEKSPPKVNNTTKAEEANIQEVQVTS